MSQRTSLQVHLLVGLAAAGKHGDTAVGTAHGYRVDFCGSLGCYAARDEGNDAEGVGNCCMSDEKIRMIDDTVDRRNPANQLRYGESTIIYVRTENLSQVVSRVSEPSTVKNNARSLRFLFVDRKMLVVRGHACDSITTLMAGAHAVWLSS